MITAEEWGKEFGDEYTDRQEIDTTERRHFWQALVEEYRITSVLEVGCHTGENLKHLSIPCAGVDVNSKVLAQVPDNITTRRASATDLPFADGEYDLVLTFGVLIHIPPRELERAMSEIVRVSRRYVFCGEYFGHNKVPYHGGHLWRRPYGALYQRLGLHLLERGTFHGEPWDRGQVDWWLLGA